MASGQTCVELCVDNLDDREMARLKELEIRELSLSELLRIEMKRLKRETVQRRVKVRMRRPFVDRV